MRADQRTVALAVDAVVSAPLAHVGIRLLATANHRMATARELGLADSLADAITASRAQTVRTAPTIL